MYLITDNNSNVVGVTSTSKDGAYQIEDSKTKYVKYGEPIVETLKAIKLSNVLFIYQDKINSIMSRYNEYELDSFADQREEWKKYTADATALTPIVDAMATARGISKEELMAKIGANVIGIATIQGQQNALEDAIKNCTTLEELEAIEV